MKKVALVISLFALIFAFTVNTASAQKVTSADKAKTEKVSSTETPAKACCASASAKTAACSSSTEAKAKTSGCAKTCTPEEAKNCSKKGDAKTDVVPVPKKN
jgi:hypothetical protein